MSVFRHTIDGQQVTEPLDWSGFSSEVVRDYRTRTIAQAYPTSARFTAEGYQILRALWLANDCQVASYQVDEQCGGVWRTVMRATIIIADCVFNLTKCEVQASLVDDGIGARIANNRRIPIRYSSERTKNRLVQPPVPELDVQVYDAADPTIGVYLGGRRMLDWFAAITHAVRYITDDTITVGSQWYSSLPDEERYAITTGYQLRTGATDLRGLYMEWTFESLFEELAKKYNLWMFITRAPDGSPVVNIEQEADTEVSPPALVQQGVEDLQQDIFDEQLFASVAVGSESGLPNLDSIEALPFLILIGHSLERFHFEGVCNTDSELDLVNKWGIDTNLIERTIAGNSDADDDIFIVQYTLSTLRATEGTDFELSRQYNPALLNFRVLGRYNMPAAVSVATADPATLLGSVEQVLNTPVPVGNISAPPTNVLQSFVVPSAQANFSAVVSDPGGNFQLNPGRYTAPVQGFYSFTFNYRFSFTFVQAQFFVLVPFVQWTRKDSAGVPYGTPVEVVSLAPPLVFQDGFYTPGTTSGPYDAQAIFGVVLSPGDYIEVRFGWRIVALSGANVTQIIAPALVPGGWTLEATAVAPGGGVIESNSDLARVIRYQWNRHIPTEAWADLCDDPRRTIAVAPFVGGLREGVALRISRTMGTGEAQIETLTDRTQPI